MKNISFAQPAWNMGFKPTTNSIHRTQERIVISDELVPGTITYWLS